MQEIAIRNQIFAYEQEIANARTEFERISERLSSETGNDSFRKEAKENFERKITEFNEQIRRLEKQLMELRVERRISNPVGTSTSFQNNNASRSFGGGGWSESDY